MICRSDDRSPGLINVPLTAQLRYLKRGQAQLRLVWAHLGEPGWEHFGLIAIPGHQLTWPRVDTPITAFCLQNALTEPRTTAFGLQNAATGVQSLGAGGDGQLAADLAAVGLMVLSERCSSSAISRWDSGVARSCRTSRSRC